MDDFHKQLKTTLFQQPEPEVGFYYTRCISSDRPLAKRVVTHPVFGFEIKPAPNLVSGDFVVESAPTIDAFVYARDLYGDVRNVYIVYALPKNGALTGPIVLDGEQDRFKDQGAIARCLNDMERPKGAPGIVPIDYDPPKAPDEQPLTWHELDAALCEVWPPLREVDRAGAASSSSHLYGLDGELLKGPGGLRHFSGLDDSSKVPQFLELLFQRLVDNGHGHVSISKAGVPLLRTYVDLAMRTPVQPDYSAFPTIEGPFERKPPSVISVQGSKRMLAAADLPEPVSMTDWQRSSEAARELLENPEMLAKAAEIHAAWTEKHKGSFLKRARKRNPSITEAEITKALHEAVYGGTLSPEFELTKEDGTPITAIDALEELWGRFMLGDDLKPSMKLRGVLDPDYHDGAQVAQLYLNFGDDGSLESAILHSFEGGKRVWFLDQALCVLRTRTNPVQLPSDSLIGRSLTGEGASDAALQGSAQTPADAAPEGGKKAIERQTDLGNARRLIRMYGLDIRFVHAWKKWLIWNGAGWAIDADGGIMRLAKATIESLHAEAQTEADEDRRKKARQYASSCEAVRRLRGMIELAESEESVTLDPQAIDADPWLLGVQNGVLELKTGTFRPARREDYILNQAGVAYDASASCPEWLAFLKKFVVDEDRIAYLQRVAGYILTGLVREEALFLLFGKGRNGKSTFREILFAMLGTYATIGDVTLIMERKQSGGGPTPEVDRLRGKRLVTINETEENAVLRDERIKSISSNDHLTARALYEGFTDFMPTHKTVITTNHKPIVKGSDDGIWARLHPLRFGVKITPEEEAKDYRERVLVPELAGILNWALAGLKEYVRGGLKVPAAVEAERGEYRHEMDRVGQWLEDRCGDDLVKGGAASQTLVSCLYADYELFSKTESGFAVSKTRFGRELGERGYEVVKRGGKKYRKGLRLLYVMPGSDTLAAPNTSAAGDVVDFRSKAS